MPHDSQGTLVSARCNIYIYGLLCGLQICQKFFGGRGSALDPTGRTHAPTDILLRGGRKGGGKGPPKPWIKKLELSCRVTHIDALAVAVINYHKTATAHK